MTTNADEYFILNLKGGGTDLLLFWCPDNKGYTFDIDKAGRYSAERVASDPRYYDDGVNAKAIPCSLVESATNRMVMFRSRLMMEWGGVYDQEAPKGRPWPYWPMATGKGWQGEDES